MHFSWPCVTIFPSFSVFPQPLASADYFICYPTGSWEASNVHLGTSEICHICWLIPSTSFLIYKSLSISVPPWAVSELSLQSCEDRFQNSHVFALFLPTLPVICCSISKYHPPLVKIRSFKQLHFILSQNFVRCSGRAWLIGINRVSWGLVGRVPTSFIHVPAILLVYGWETGLRWLPLNLQGVSL